MRIRTLSSFLFAALWTVCLPAAQGALADTTGEELNERCARAQSLLHGSIVDPMSAMKSGQCMSFVEGLTIGLEVGALLDESGRAYCPPEDFTSTDAIVTIQAFFADYPELTGEGAGILAADALLTAYPCTTTLSANTN